MSVPVRVLRIRTDLIILQVKFCTVTEMNGVTRSSCIIAIDFGTAGTGFAFSFKRNDFVHEGKHE